MAKAADDILVQVGVDIGKMDRDFRTAEKRADTAASRLRKAFTLSDMSLGGRQAWLGGLSVVGASMAIGRGLNTYMSGERAGFGAVGDFTDALMKSVPVLNDFYEAGKKMHELIAPDSAAMFGKANNLRDQLSLKAALLSGDPAAIKREKRAVAHAEYMALLDQIRKEYPIPELIETKARLRTGKGGELAVEEIVKGTEQAVASATALQKRLDMAARTVLEAGLAAADRGVEIQKPQELKQEARQMFDTFSTVFGSFKARRMHGDPASDTATNTEKMSKTLEEMKKMMKDIARIASPFS